MASIIEAYDSTMKEAFTGIKIFLWAIPLSIAFSSANFVNVLIAVVVCYLLIGFTVTLAHNTISKSQVVVPSVDFVKMAINGIIGLLAMLPYAAIGAIIFWGYSSFVHIPSPVWDTTLKIVVGLFALSFPLTSLCILVRRLNILEVFNIKKFCLGIFEVFLSYSFFMVRAGLALSLVIGFLIYLFTLFIGFANSFWTYILACTAMLAIVLTANAIAQISDDVYTFIEKEEEKKREEARVKNIISEQQKIRDLR